MKIYLKTAGYQNMSPPFFASTAFVNLPSNGMQNRLCYAFLHKKFSFFPPVPPKSRGCFSQILSFLNPPFVFLAIGMKIAKM